IGQLTARRRPPIVLSKEREARVSSRTEPHPHIERDGSEEVTDASLKSLAGASAPPVIGAGCCSETRRAPGRYVSRETSRRAELRARSSELARRDAARCSRGHCSHVISRH